MYWNRIAALLGAAAGAAAAATGAAGADPVEATWPFGDFQLPGVSSGAHLTGDLFLTGVEPYTDPGGDFSAHFDGIELAFVGYLIHREVFDSANPAVPDGTTWDGISLPGFADTLIVAPAVGIGDQITLGALSNDFIVDTAGIQDLVTLGDNPPVTLFDLPIDLSTLP